MLSLSLCVVPRKVETSLHYNNPCYYYPTNITCQNKPQLYIEIEGRGRAFMMRTPCCEKMGLKKGPWTPDEDEKLLAYIQHHGHGSWRSLPKHAGLLRCGKSCRLRWTNYLRPDIKRGNFSCEEEEIIINLHSLLGNRWSSIASHLPGRTDNEIKNYWNTHLKKRLLQMGLDPMNHKPLLDGHHTLALPLMRKAPCDLILRAHNHSRDEHEGMSRHIGDSGIGNKSQDCFHRNSDDSRVPFLRAMNFPSSYLEQLQSCGLDISGFLTQRYKQAIRLQKQEQDAQLQQNPQPISLIDAKHAPNDIILQSNSITVLSSDGSNNSTAQCVDNLSPCSPLSSFGFSSLHQESESNVWSKRKLTFSDVGIGLRKRREENECEMGQDFHSTCAIPCNTFVGDGQIHVKPDQASDKITRTNPQHMRTMNCTPCELLPLSSTSLQCSQTLALEQEGFMTPKHMMNVIVKEEEMLCGTRSPNNGHDLGLNCFMPLLTPDMCLGFEVEMEGNGGGATLNQVSRIGKTW